MLADKLKAARIAAGMSTRRVSELLPSYGAKASHATISAHERNQSAPSPELLVALSELYQRPLQWFVSTQPTLTDVRYRQIRARVRVPQQAAYEVSVTRWLNAYQRIEHLLSDSLPSGESEEIAVWNCPRQAAIWLRSRLELTDQAPVSSVFSVLELLSIRAIEMHSSINADGLTARLGDEHVFVMNSGAMQERTRLDAVSFAFKCLVRRTGCEEQGKEDHLPEGWFERAASYFLVPDEAVEEAFVGKSLVRILQFNKRYGVSLSELVLRAEGAGLVSECDAARLWSEFAKRGWRERQPWNVWPDRPWRFEYLIDIAHNVQEKSWLHLSELCGVREDELRTRLSRVFGAEEKPMIPAKEAEKTRGQGLRLAN